ncbi:hypothetical protein Q4F19_18480 [Sphingomonas sp. BIUV-7]|uniref:DUF4440 domain-containing protein n=1 Tax=Sphingomonas natans TaxID=3063330 RepID=A0ABT8YDF7_9SPHN|nr:hypothetical protein [Sphingomonas sp. BIUV-7]MDO6416379.1 hypothetical protein [Sphingomonas sp. BIUV-7]
MLLSLFAAAALTAADRAAVLAPVEATFAALAAHNGQAILAQTWGTGGATVATEKEDGTRSVRQLSWAQFAEAIKPAPETYEEKLGDTILRVDGDIAMVWGRYTFRIDGKVHHCGIDHFQLTRISGQWKITNLSWSTRTTGCGA